MKELKCPNCGKIFTVDEAGYAAILSQVKNKEFDRELEKRLHDMAEAQKAQHEAEGLKAEQTFQSKLAAKDVALGKKDAEIVRLTEQLNSLDQKAAVEYGKQLNSKDQTIAELKAQIDRNDSDKKVAILQEQNRAKDELQQKDNDIARLNAQIEADKNEAIMRTNSMKESYELKLKQAQEQVEYYKDMKVRMTTKMIGESLEQHCWTLYNTNLRSAYPTAYFEKDNDASEGSKGDFIFRDKDGDMEYISIMFEMKNELENGGKKHKNEDFFKKLDEDRNKKHCEYAVLVSMLEPENEYYNNGIVDVSYRYPKMYVIRPQFFIPLITLLVSTSKKSVEYKRELQIARSQSVDVTNFEAKLEAFKGKFLGHYQMAAKKYQSAIDDIDATIKKLQKVRDELVSSENSLRLANKDTDELTIRKLTYKNPTMKAKFDEARNNSNA
mgnify:FL=1